MGKSFVGNVGLEIYCRCYKVITGATGVVIKVQKPDETTTEWTASIYGTEYVKYTIQSGDFDQAGEYRLQPYFTLGTWVGRCDTAEYAVYAIFTKHSSGV